MDKRFGFQLFAAAMVTTLLMAGCSKTPEVTFPASAPVSNVTDIDVSEHVKTALQQNDLLKTFDITVVTTKGDVRLTGALNTQVQIDEALKIARAAEGVHSVHDELTLKK